MMYSTVLTVRTRIIEPLTPRRPKSSAPPQTELKPKENKKKKKKEERARPYGTYQQRHHQRPM